LGLPTVSTRLQRIAEQAVGVISPILSNIFLHHVLDRWYVRDVKDRLRGRSFLIRFADDFIIGCEREDDARRVLAALPRRFERFKLTTHPAKTALIWFQRPSSKKRTDNGNGTFDFLGFTHFWARTRQGYSGLARALCLLWDSRELSDTPADLPCCGMFLAQDTGGA
jgi:hypothetical protein